jgi:hypothetical protein
VTVYVVAWRRGCVHHLYSNETDEEGEERSDHWEKEDMESSA